VRRAALVALVIGAATLAACGGGSDKKADPVPAKIVLQQSDFPSGWSSKPHQTSPEDATANQRFFQCIGAVDPKTQQRAEAHSPDFTEGQLNRASSQAQVLAKEADAADALAALQGPKTVECMKSLVQESAQKQLPAGVSVSDVNAAQLKFPTLKDGTAAVQVSFAVQTGGVNVPIYADIIYFKSGRALVSLSTVNSGSPMDSKLEESLAQKMADRA
jgi:hypothetical protein